jgi:hypothetical protein
MSRLRRLLPRRRALPVEAAPPPVAAPVAPSAPEPLPGPDLEQLEAEARHHRERFDLYRARAFSAKPTSLARLRELERIAATADARLRHARRS